MKKIFFLLVSLMTLSMGGFAQESTESMLAQPLIKAIALNKDIASVTQGEDEYEGFLSTHWSQNGVYNQFCPMDPATGNRSLAGCVAVAMAQVVNHLKTTNGTRFNDGDDYEHYYPYRYYTIDDDYEGLDFLSFPEINRYLVVIDSLYDADSILNSKEIAALIFTCGVACKQVFTSEVSGTSGVQQAYNAYRRFGFDRCQLLTEADSLMYAMLNENLERGIPAHLAVESPDATMGHNVVVDGYRKDGTYHINFGYGGLYDGWYTIPSQDFPYGLSKLEGIILNLVPSESQIVVEKPLEKVKVYPNPARDFITVENVDAATEVVVFNSVGEKVLCQTITHSEKINIQHLPKGIYVIKVVDSKKESASSKLLIY